MSKKSDRIQQLVGKVELPGPVPSADLEGSLLERGLYALLLRELPEARAKGGVLALRAEFEDYNEARVSQAQELARIIAPKGKGLARLSKYMPAARRIKEYLQAIFQEIHGLDLEELASDPVGLGRQLASIEVLGSTLTSYLLYLAEGGELPVLAGNVRVLDRMGLMARTTSVRKAREVLDPQIPEKERLRTAIALGLVADRWCDARKPLCWECPLLDECPNGKKVFKEWKVQQERLEKQRQKEEARAAAQAKKEEARRKREEEREAKAQAAADRKRERERERLKKAKAREEEGRKRRQAAEKKREAAAKKKAAEAKKKEAAKKKAAAKKKTAAKKKPAKKKPAKKKPAKKATKKKAAKKATKKKTAKKATKKKAAKKPAAKKKAAQKSTKKKAPRRR